MKAISFSESTKRFGAVIFLLALAVARPVMAQPYDPIIGPSIRITSPANHAVFYAPVDIPIFAFVVSPASEGTRWTNVEFFAGTNDLGRGFDLGSTNRRPPQVYANFVTTTPLLPRTGSVYCLVWTNAPVGSYALTAVVTGSLGLISKTSAPVNITILLAGTNSNPADVVSIVATDPIAIAGTNSYVWPGMSNATPAWTTWPPPVWQSFTNWGPKDALFTVRRYGDASNPLTVNYAIGGTASNGVNYAALPGYVTIPAGGAYALIPIVPIDTGSFPKTVVLTLTASTNLPPDYVVGIPSRAAALILKVWPRPLPFLLPDGSFHVNAEGPDGAWFAVQNSGDLENWSAVSTNQVFQGSIDFIDPDASNNSSGFYRAVQVTNTPAD
jgi:hypothetical protein